MGQVKPSFVSFICNLLNVLQLVWHPANPARNLSEAGFGRKRARFQTCRSQIQYNLHDDDDVDVDGDMWMVICTGPQFALHCVGSLLLPTLQAWLRRPMTSLNMACWDTTTVANFKHYTGLCVDLVVELVVQFTGLTFYRILKLIYFQRQLVLHVTLAQRPSSRRYVIGQQLACDPEN